jgi:2-amino-4-hydroxy-6-hydroxymethyldihydropteridine diphosphokinase
MIDSSQATGGTLVGVGLGANLGEARSTLEAACRELAALPVTRLEQVSSWYRSAPVDADGPDYVNGVALLRTALEPTELLDALMTIEAHHGRRRSYRNAPRPLDLDLLLYGMARIETERLQVPHPRLADRAFVLLPLLQVLPTLRLAGVDDLIERAQRLAREQRIERLM